MYEYVFFDLDGTLTDPGIGITNSVAHAYRRMNLEVPKRRELYKYIGPPLHESFIKYCNLSEKDGILAVDYFREYFADKGIFENIVYPDIEETLISLRAAGYKLVLATSKPEFYAKQILEHFSLTKYFDFVSGANMDSTRTLKADVIANALDALNLRNQTEKIVMIGDREHDIIGAKTFSIDTIGVTYGYGSLEELKGAKANYIAKSPKDILNILLN